MRWEFFLISIHYGISHSGNRRELLSCNETTTVYASATVERSNDRRRRGGHVSTLNANALTKPNTEDIMKINERKCSNVKRGGKRSCFVRKWKVAECDRAENSLVAGALFVGTAQNEEGRHTECDASKWEEFMCSVGCEMGKYADLWQLGGKNFSLCRLFPHFSSPRRVRRRMWCISTTRNRQNSMES